MSQMSIDGLVSGLSTSQLISQLMQLERQPQVRLQTRRTAADRLVTIYQALNTRLVAVRDAARDLATAGGWQVFKATSSDAAAAVATATSAAVPTSLSFTVDRLAGAHSLITVGAVASTSEAVAVPGSNLFLARAGGLGFSGLAASAGLATGTHTVEVTQASSGAGQSGSPLDVTVTVAAGATLEVALDGSTATTHSFVLAEGTYSRAGLADMVGAATGGLLSATVANDGSLLLATTREGSAARLAVTGGSGMATLGLAASASASSGGDGVVEVDGVATTVTDTSGAVTLDAGGGETLHATFSGGLRAGTVTASNVSVGTGTLAAVAGAINSAGAGMTAGALQVAPGVYKLQISSTAPGTAGALSLDTSAFASTLGALETLSVATDAQITVGSGPAAVRVTSAANTFAGVLPGVTLSTLQVDPARPITVTVARDSAALAERVGELVEAVNGVLSHIKAESSYNAASGKGGPLLGNATARQVESLLYRTVTGGASLAEAGLSLQRDGTVSFDGDAFIAAYEADPAAMASFFGGSDGLGVRLEAMAKAAIDGTSGIVTSAINGRRDEIRTLDQLIGEWDVRLQRREAALRRQFTGLERALGTLRNQSNWLAGHLASLYRTTSSA